MLWFVWLIIGAAFLIVSAAVMCSITNKIAEKVYKDILVRTDHEKWGRHNSAPWHEEHSRMYEEGIAWGDANKDKMRDVSIRSEDSFTLVGQYFDFGFDRCAILIPGRSESLLYTYYFAEPYQKAGYNILVMDQRAHGNSEGIYNTVGIKESDDLVRWIRFVEGLGNNNVVLHGICVGGASCVMAAARPDFPPSVKAIITEGLYISFPESFKQHMICDKRPVYPILWQIMAKANRNIGINLWKESPKHHIKKMKLPFLFLHGKEDKFSLPKTADYLFEKCTSQKKKLVWFEKGSHSHLRINNTAQYDEAISAFLEQL